MFTNCSDNWYGLMFEHWFCCAHCEGWYWGVISISFNFKRKRFIVFPHFTIWLLWKMLCACSGEQHKFEEAPQSPDSLATRDFSASGLSSRTGDWDSKLNENQVEDAESSLKEAASLNYEVEIKEPLLSNNIFNFHFNSNCVCGWLKLHLVMNFPFELW